MLTALQRSGGIDALARQAGVELPQALGMARAVMPALLTALRDVQGGRSGLLAEFDKQGGAGLAAMVMGMDRADTAPGMALLEGVLAKDGAGLAAQAGASSELLLPLLVMLVCGYASAMAAGLGAGPQGLDALLGYGT